VVVCPGPPVVPLRRLSVADGRKALEEVRGMKADKVPRYSHPNLSD